MDFIKRTLRYFIFIPVCIVSLRLVYFGFFAFLVWLVSCLSWLQGKVGIFWLWVILFIIGFGIIALIWNVFKAVCAITIGLLRKISPSPYFGFWFILIFSIINAFWALYDVWSIPDNFSFKAIAGCTVASFMIIGLSYSIIICANIKVEDAIK